MTCEPGSIPRVDPVISIVRALRVPLIMIVIVGCGVARGVTTGGLRWKIRFDTGLVPDITIAIRMDRTNTAALDYYLLPQFEMRTKPLGLAEENGLMLDAFRFETLDFFFDMARRVPVAEVAPW